MEPKKARAAKGWKHTMADTLIVKDVMTKGVRVIATTLLIRADNTV
ncbi:MAG: hypothetical protein ACFFCT_05655 [Candidatus Odinarchaeota archaeon]